MKFILVMTLCSATFQTCLPPNSSQTVYDSYYDCATAGYINSLGVLQQLDIENVNDNKIVINFECLPQTNT